MPIARIEHLHKRYGDTIAVDDVSLSLEEGEILGILGPNGAGKTTTVECLAGLRHPDSGIIEINGLDPITDRARVRLLVGVQLQETRLPDKLRVGEAVELYASFYPDPEDTDGLLEALGLSSQRPTAFEDLSGGQQQRLSIALALVGRPRVAVLDELTTGLDPHARRETWQLIEGMRASGVAVVLVSHSMQEAERLCDRVAVIDGGRVVALGTPEALIAEVVGELRVRFRPPAGLDRSVLADQPEVSEVAEEGRWWVVDGSGDLVGAATRVLTEHGMTSSDLRTETPSLDDAFLALTGRPAGGSEAAASAAAAEDTTEHREEVGR